MSAFRVALRISRRNAWRSKKRSALILTMIALPVLIATCLATMLAGYLYEGDYGGDLPLGRADVVVSGSPDWTHMSQDGQGGVSWDGEMPDHARSFTAPEVTAMFGPESRVVRADQGELRYLTPQGYRTDVVRQADLRDPIFQGTSLLLDGRLPKVPGEVVISRDARDRGLRIGQTLVAGRTSLHVVGAAIFPNGMTPDFVAYPGSLPDGAIEAVGPEMSTFWMVDAPTAVSWADVPRLNSRGLVVVSGAAASSNVVEAGSVGGADLELVPWIAIMWLEVVLLAGPAFAVGQRRRAREFALLSVQGASPRQIKGVARADGLIFGVTASLLGAAAGIGTAAQAAPWFSGWYGKWPGGFTIPWTAVMIIIAMGTTAGLLASLAPARGASHTDPVAVLTGRRAPGRDRAGRPVLGLVLILAGVTGMAVGARTGVFWIVSAALISQLGLVAVLPWLIARAARVAGTLPLPLRFAVRDAARNRARTTPAVAAVMTAVTLFTALGLAWRSGLSAPPVVPEDYPQGPAGALWIRGDDLGTELWDRVRALVRAAIPAGVPVIEAKTLTSASGEPLQAQDRLPDSELDNQRIFADNVDPSGRGGLLVGDERLLRYVLGRDDPSAVAALRSGKAVVLNPTVVHGGKVDVDLLQVEGMTSGDMPMLHLPAIGVRPSGRGWAHVVVSPETIAKHGYATETTLLVVDPDDFRVPPGTARRLLADLEKLSPQVTGRLEGAEPVDDSPILLLLAAAAAVLVLGVTFVATGLAAAEARHDFAVMSAVGAAPRTRRYVKAGQALVIALAGTMLGVVAGLLAGVAVRWGLIPRNAPKRIFGADGLSLTPAHQVLPVIVVPWNLIAILVVGLPLLAALVCAVFTRSRLPAPRRRPA
ncbi:hypothetical protein GCM10023194_01370 [Planotetraspora phitsanulokensis]|uniref:ABC3 transporter permease C-terminal domain-containing protein n=1 Tax=Planotetraspora phitsanulokensis TaxID=575192 RepID=A0A8J3UJZ6_9ACTN|nr:ABC transporter permease [Planotetraspora phitsanulokensis]GII40170.1 hypothetical protein Pph01_51730 [Planotetraspora phitsanulokensis]